MHVKKSFYLVTIAVHVYRRLEEIYENTTVALVYK